MIIRTASSQDIESIKRVYFSAFPKDEREVVAQLAIDLLVENTTPQIVSLVVETEDTIVGHIGFSPVEIDNADSGQAYILAPLAVHSDYQKRGIGSSLIAQGIKRLSAMAVNILFVYGDPDYYGRFGFKSETAFNYRTPYKLQYPSGWQAMFLNNCSATEKSVAITCVAPLCDAKYW
jgi:putative acetyltransferase